MIDWALWGFLVFTVLLFLDGRTRKMEEASRYTAHPLLVSFLLPV